MDDTSLLNDSPQDFAVKNKKSCQKNCGGGQERQENLVKWLKRIGWLWWLLVGKAVVQKNKLTKLVVMWKRKTVG